MLDTTQLTKDIGSILVGREAVEKGIINEVGGIQEALKKLHSMIAANKSKECSDK
jgi:ATP-dependent protease ClpP protease subunit